MNWRWKVAQAAEIWWWRNYLRNKEPQTYLRQKRMYWERVLRMLEIEVPPAAKALDAGCGPAGVFLILPDWEVDAIDPLLNQYKTHLSHFQPEQYPWVRFRQLAIESLNDQLAYDYIFCLNVINHVADLEQSLCCLYQAARPGCTLVLSVDSHNHRFFRRLFSWLPGDILHPHQYYLQEYVEKLAGTGWTVERTCQLKKGFIFDYHGIIAKKSEAL